jgi:hypothetical protein
VLWPGDSAWIPGINYPIEGNDAVSAGNLLASFVLNNLGGAAAFSFASHSLGARVVLQAIRGMGGQRRVRRLMLMAGAIDDSCLNDEYADAAATVEKICVLASTNDDVLKLAFPGGNFLAGLISRGSPYVHVALGREGPQSALDGKIQWDWDIPDPWKYGHHHYLAQQMRVPQWTAPSMPQALPMADPALPGWGTYDDWRAAWSGAWLSSCLT